MTVSFGILLPVLCSFSIAALVLSREVLERREIQSAADAMALAAAHSLEQLGTPLQTTLALPLGPRNARLPVNAQFDFERRAAFPEYRSVVRVKLSTVFDSQQGWFPTRMLPLNATAFAQINENVYGDKWPAMVFAIDASKSMGFPILGSATTPAFTVIQQLVLAYAANTLPVRNGVVIFNDHIVSHQAPPLGNVNNLVPIQQAFAQATPIGLTNARAGLNQAQIDLTNQPEGRNVIFISDGEPTSGPCGPDKSACHFDEAALAADQLRHLATDGVALFTVEIRRSNYWAAVTEFMHRISGGPLTDGNDPTMSFAAQSMLGIAQFITGLTRSICAFGPLTPQPGLPADGATDPYRLRPSNPNPAANPRRIFAFLREQNGAETPIPLVQNRDLTPTVPGFEYMTNPKGAFVILTLASCNALGADASRRLVVRWEDPQLVPCPTGSSLCTP